MRSAVGWLVGILSAVLIALPAHAAQLAFVTPANRERVVAIEPIARQLGWTFHRTADGAVLDDGSGPQMLRIGSRNVREDDTDVSLFDSPATERNGAIVLAIDDAATLFHLSIVQNGANVALVNQPEADADIRENPRPATPAPLPARPAQPQPFNPPALVQGNAGTLAISVQFDGSSRIYQTSVAGNAGLVRGALSTYGNDALTAPIGLVTLGAPAHSLSYGSVNNPLAGSVITNGTLTGLDAHLTSGTTSYDAYSGQTPNGSLAAFERSTGNISDTFAIVSPAGGFDQAILSHAVISPQSWGTIDYDTLFGERGEAAGIHLRTRGRTFIDANASVASGTLPLGDGDLPTGAVIGQALSSTTTLTAGYVHSINAPGSPTFGVSTRIDGVTLGANISKYFTNLTAGYSGPRGYGSLFVSAGLSRLFGATGGIALHNALAEFDFNNSGGATTGVAQLRTNHSGLNYAAGIDLNAGLLRPLVGVVAPLTASLALEVGVVPAPSGRPGLRISMLAGFRQPRPHVTTYPVAIVVPDAAQYGPLQIFVDGARAATPYTDGTQVRIPAGWHTVYVQSSDRAFGSLPHQFSASGPTTIDLALWPQRTIAGYVRFGGSPDAVPSDASLEGIRVVLEPSGESATTDAGGHFIFPLAPYDPASTILLDPASVPPAFVAPDALPVGNADTVVTLAPARRTERAVFH